jgi:hypothetical protein
MSERSEFVSFPDFPSTLTGIQRLAVAFLLLTFSLAKQRKVSSRRATPGLPVQCADIKLTPIATSIYPSEHQFWQLRRLTAVFAAVTQRKTAPTTFSKRPTIRFATM